MSSLNTHKLSMFSCFRSLAYIDNHKINRNTFSRSWPRHNVTRPDQFLAALAIFPRGGVFPEICWLFKCVPVRHKTANDYYIFITMPFAVWQSGYNASSWQWQCLRKCWINKWHNLTGPISLNWPCLLHNRTTHLTETLDNWIPYNQCWPNFKN